MCVVWETRWDDNAQLPTLPPLLQVHPRPFWLNAMLAQGHFGSRPSYGGVGGGDGDGGADGDRDE